MKIASVVFQAKAPHHKKELHRDLSTLKQATSCTLGTGVVGAGNVAWDL